MVKMAKKLASLAGGYSWSYDAHSRPSYHDVTMVIGDDGDDDDVRLLHAWDVYECVCVCVCVGVWSRWRKATFRQVSGRRVR